jgi:hypothetical protein
VILPSFPRTAHLPYQPNASSDDPIASESEASIIFREPLNIEEKIDGASVGMALVEGHPLIRNRDHILQKGYVKNTPAKEQFRSVWGWFHEHQDRFEYLATFGALSVYGEWCVARHGLDYDKLPDWFIAYDLYDQEAREFLDPVTTRAILEGAGFAMPHLFYQGYARGLKYEDIALWAKSSGRWTKCGAPIEGVYLKTFDRENERVTRRFKMVREGFVQGALWDPKRLTRNALARASGEASR